MWERVEGHIVIQAHMTKHLCDIVRISAQVQAVGDIGDRTEGGSRTNKTKHIFGGSEIADHNMTSQGPPAPVATGDLVGLQEEEGAKGAYEDDRKRKDTRKASQAEMILARRKHPDLSMQPKFERVCWV